MCAGCALAAMTSASGVRAWLQNRHLTWLTPKRMRSATAAIFVVATLVSSVGLSGSSKAVQAHPHAASAHAAR